MLYFTYWTPKGGIFQLGGGIMTPEGPSGEYVPGAHYWHAQRINSVLKAWGPTLMDLTSSGVYRVPPMSDPGTILQGCAISNLTQTGHHGALNYLIGQFTRASDGATAVLLNNWEVRARLRNPAPQNQCVCECSPPTNKQTTKQTTVCIHTVANCHLCWWSWGCQHCQGSGPHDWS